MFKHWVSVWSLSAALGLMAGLMPLGAQTLTGSISGSVKDSSSLFMGGVTVTVENLATGATRETTTNDQGDFVLSGLTAAEYKLVVSMDGFRSVERKRVILGTSERLAIPVITLEVGSVNERITVTAEAAALQTVSSERSGLITNTQVDNLLIRGRNVMSLLQLMPGVVNAQDTDTINRNWSMNVNGNRGNTTNLTLDGLSLINVGGGQGHVVQIGQDTIAEVKILLSNYQAEYGMMAGANVSMVTKSGTRDFHGLGSYFKRHEQFNANNFFSNRLNQERPRNRQNIWNYNVGGPVYLPGRFNRNRDKLFFFWSQEFWPTTLPQSTRQVTVPTELERTGDFSQSLDVNGRLITVNDPANNKQPFPGTRIPLNRLDASGRALLNVFPIPNFLDRSISRGAYNYIFQTENRQIQKLNLLKLDYHLNPSNMFSFTSAGHGEEYEGYLGLPTSGSTNWPQMEKTYAVNSRTYQARYQTVFSPTLLNELSIGHVRLFGRDEFEEPELSRNQRITAGFTAGQLYPGSNPLSVLPNVTFDTPSAANLALEARFPFRTRQYRFDLTNNITKTAGAHTIKAGILVDRVWSSPSLSTSFNGTFNFSRSANNPLDTGYSYSNAALGNFLNYTESSRSGGVHARSLNVEWFAQDNWKVNRQLTLDYGLRFSIIRPIYERDNLVSAFSSARFDPNAQVRLIQPRLVGGARAGVDPVTGTVYSSSLIGAIVPGSGDVSNGMGVPGTNGVPRGLIDDRGVQYAPRIGFAWDVLGKGRTALRGGFGMFYNRASFDSLMTGAYATQAPVMFTPTLLNGALSGLTSASGFQFPASVLAIDQRGKVPTVMNFSLSAQTKLGWNTILDAGYTGSLGRNLMWARQLNPITPGANFQPSNADPANPSSPLASAFLRPVTGYQDITQREWAASSNYHSLQVTATRRYAYGLQFGGAWTWSKALDYNDSDTELVSPFVPVRVWNYGLASFDRTHTLRLNWVWDIPASGVQAAPLRAVLDNWQVSGIASFVSGQPLGIGYSTVTPIDITGTASQGARIVVTGNPVLPKSERTFSRNFRTDVFALPQVGTFGNAAKTLIRGPGVNNWDIAVFKSFPIREQVRLQFRWETYNSFNHTQFSGLDTTARFDAAGNQVNTRLGEYTAARSPRQMQFVLRLYF